MRLQGVERAATIQIVLEGQSTLHPKRSYLIGPDAAFLRD
jgi:hypothetical protein